MISIIVCASVPAIVALAAGNEFDAKSPEFNKILNPDSTLKKLAGGMKFTEGPVWVAKGAYLLFSDIPANQIRRWSAKEGLSTWLEPSHNANGHTLDRDGNLISCEHSSRRVTRMTLDAPRTITVLAGQYRSKRLNSPNDCAAKRDGTIWFTDPHYGIHEKLKEQPKNGVYRLDPSSHEPVAVCEDFDMPNGLCFSPDEKRLYIADSGKSGQVRVFDVTSDNRLINGRVFAPRPGDGMRTDTEGRLYVTWDQGVCVYAPSGEHLGTIRVPEGPANCEFGGDGFHTLFITARSSICAITLASTGAPRP